MSVLTVLRTQYDDRLAALVYAGEKVVLELQLQAPAAAGAYTDEDLTGRAFVQRVFTADGEVLAQAPGEAVVQGDDRFLRFTLTGDQVTALLAGRKARDLKHVVYELVDGGDVRVIDPQTFAIRLASDPAASAPVSAEPSDEGAGVRFVIQRDSRANRVVARAVAGRGRSALEIVVAAGAEGLSPTATDEEFEDWLTARAAERAAGQLNGSAEAALDAAGAATAAAGLANQAAVQAQAVIAAGDTLLAAGEEAQQTVQTAQEIEESVQYLADIAVAAAPDPLLDVPAYPEGSLLFTDANGDILGALTPTGWVLDRVELVSQLKLAGAARLSAELGLLVPTQPGEPGRDAAEIFLDSTGRQVGYTTPDGVTYWLQADLTYQTSQDVKRPLDLSTLWSEATSSHLPAKAALMGSAGTVVDLFTPVGQSWIVAQRPLGYDLAVTVAPEFPGLAFMPQGKGFGPRPDGGSVSNWVDLQEDAASDYRNETPSSGAMSAIMRARQAAFGFMPPAMIGAAANGGSAYAANGPGEGLIQGSPNDVEHKRIVAGGAEWAKKQGWAMRHRAVLFGHGEADYSLGTPRHVYEGFLHQVQARTTAWSREITGFNDEVLLVCYQHNWGTLAPDVENQVASAQLDAALNAKGRIICAGPVYDSDASDDGHVDNPSYRAAVGTRLGWFAQKASDGVTVYPMMVVAHRWQAADVLDLDYTHPVAILSDDSEINVSNLGPGKGYEFFEDVTAPTTAATVTGISLVAGKPNTLRVTLSKPATGRNPRLFIAQRGTPGPSGYRPGRIYGARAGVRSVDPFDTDPLTGRVLYHRACHQVLQLRKP